VAAAAPRAQAAQALAAAKPGNAVSVFNAGLAALDAGMEDQALPLVEAAIRLHPRDPRVWQVAGLLYRQREELEPAIVAFRHAAALAPTDARIVHSLARVHLEAGLPAVDLFRAAWRLAPNDGDVILGLVAAIAAQDGLAPALDQVERVLAHHPLWVPGHDLAARLRWELGDCEGFTTSLERVLRAQPRNLDLWTALVLILVNGDLYDRALDAVARGRRAAGEALVFEVNEALCRSEQGEGTAVDPLFARLAHVDDPTVRVRHVRHLLRTGRPAEAAAIGETMLDTPAAVLFWPYVATAWRMTDDPRWAWLEGDPSFVGVYDIAERLPPIEALAERLRGLHRSSHQPLEQSVRGGTQTDGALFARIEPEIRALRKAVADTVAEHVAQLPPPEPGHPLLAADRGPPVRFSGSWSVRLTGGGHHANHVHPMGWFSSALYVALPPAETRGAEPAGWLTLGEPQAQLGLDVPPFRLVEPKPGRLVLFPSTMWHGTRPFDAGERLTVAFDVARPAP
jgi:cytochrome c-type biogenesis protein CcmH/NrfG